MPRLHCPSIPSEQPVLNLASKLCLLSHFVHVDLFSMICPLSNSLLIQTSPTRQTFAFPDANQQKCSGYDWALYFISRTCISHTLTAACASAQDFSITGEHFLQEELSWGKNKTACMVLVLAFGHQGELLAQSGCTACFCVPDPSYKQSAGDGVTRQYFNAQDPNHISELFWTLFGIQKWI